ncbi:MAG: response regulator [Myxococcota bacterium]
MGARVLVVDDDPWILRMVTATLQKRDYVVDTAREGRQALERANANPPDVIISDVMMPVMDGWAFVEHLRQDPRLASIPVIFLTALGKDEARIAQLGLSPDDFLAKPFRFDALEKRVAVALSKPAATPAPGPAPAADGSAPRAPHGQPHPQGGYDPYTGQPQGVPPAGNPMGQQPPPPGYGTYGGYPHPGYAPPQGYPGYGPPPGYPGYGPPPGYPPQHQQQPQHQPPQQQQQQQQQQPPGPEPTTGYAPSYPTAPQPPSAPETEKPLRSPPPTSEMRAVGGDARTPRRTTALNGRLEQLQLSSLLVMMEMERKNGLLSLKDSKSGAIGRIFLRGGQVISANLSEPAHEGKEAVYEMLRWKAGTFSFNAMDVEMEDTVKSSTTHLLMEGARLIDEANRDEGF